MNCRSLRDTVLSACLLAVAAVVLTANAQGPPHGGPPPGAPGPGSPGSLPGGTTPGFPGGPGKIAPPRTDSRSGNNVAHSSHQFGPVGRWWDDKSVIRSVGIRKDQQKKMDSIFDSNRQAILDSYKSFLSEQAKLDKLNRDPKSDQASVFAAIDSVSKARAALQKATAQMLLQIRQEMDPEQISKLEKLP